MANIEEAIRRLKFLYETHGAEDVAAAQRAITASTETTEKASLSLEKSFNNLERRYVSTVRAQQDYQRVQDKVNDAIKQNPALQERGNVILANANQQYLLATQGLDKYGKAVLQSADSSRLARHELINLSRQFQDVGVSLASGQSPLTVAIQQGAQIADVFANSTGTLKGFLGQAVAGARGFITSTAGIATGVAAFGAAMVLAAVQFKSGQNDIERALSGVGAASGVTSKQINEIGAASSSAFGLSSSEARTAATAFAATGRIYGDNVALATATVKDFAKATGTDAAEATKQLGAALVDPAKGALELNKQFGFLDVTTLNYIRSLQAQGKEQEAQKALMEALIPKLQKMAEHTSGMASAWDLAANAASNFFGIAGKYGPFGTGDRPTAFGPPKELLQPREDPEQARLKQMGTDADAAALKINGVAAQIQQLQGELAKLSQYREAINGVETAAEQIGNVRLQQLLDQEAALVRQAQVTQQIAAMYPGMSIEVAKQLDAMNGQLLVAQARTGAEQIIAKELDDQATYMAQGKTQEEAAALAAANRATAEANVKKAIDDQIQSLNDEIALSKARINGTEAATAAELEYNKAIRQGASELDAQALKSKIRERDAQVAREKGGRYYSQNQSDATNAANAANDAAGATDNYTDSTKRASSATKDYGNEQDEAGLAAERAANAQMAANQAVGIGTDGMHHFGWEVAHVTMQTYQMIDAFKEFNLWFNAHSKEWQIDNRLWGMATQFEGQTFESTYDPLGTYQQKLAMENAFGAENVEPRYQSGTVIGYQLKQSYYDAQNAKGIEGLDVSSPGAIQSSLQQALPMGDMGPINRLIDIADPSQQTSLIQQTIDYIRQTEPPGLATEEKIRSLTDKMEQLANSTDSLNATMQSALSPFYSQDPRTTKLGFRAGVTGNPDWATGATNANPLVAVLGPGATAPGMAGGGSFVVGGGYSANDNRMAVFPVASGEEIVVNRNKEGTGGQVVHIDNRIFVSGNVDNDALSKMKVSRYQQAQRMRAGMAQA